MPLKGSVPIFNKKFPFGKYFDEFHAFLKNIDDCKQYDNDLFNENHGCHHTKFQNESAVLPVERLFGHKVKSCCGYHGYQFIDYCEVISNTESA